MSGRGPSPWPTQLRRPVRPEPALRQQVIAAFYRALEHGGGLAVAIKPQQAEDGAGAAADDVELLIGGNQVVGEQYRRGLRVGAQAVVIQDLGHRGECIDDRAQPGGAADAE